MSKIKRSMSVRPAPITEDGVSRAYAPKPDDQRWVAWYPNSANRTKWTGPWGYVICRVTNSTDVRPGWLLTKAQVNSAIEKEWTVTVLSDV